MSITFQISDSVLKDIEKRLDGIKKPEAVVKTAVNNTAKKARKALASKASKEYAGQITKQGVVLSASRIIKANVSRPTAIIKFRSGVHEIKEFHVSSLSISKTTYRKNGKRGGKKIKGNVLKGTPKQLENAFVVNFKNGHVAVVSRVPGSHMRSNPKKEKIRKLLSPSYPVMIGSDRVYGKTSIEIANILNNQVYKVMDKVLGGN